MSTISIAKNLERQRLKSGLTQDRVASFLGISRSTYNLKENGKSDVTVSEVEKLAALYDIPPTDFFDTMRDNEKFKQMYFYTLAHFKSGIPKTKLAKLLYLADFSYYYDNLESISAVKYIRRDYGPVADIFFEFTEDMYDQGKIGIKSLDYALLIYPSTKELEANLLSESEKERIDEICNLWKNKRTEEIVNYTHEQKPWKNCRNGEVIPYSLIIQEDPEHVYTPTT